MNVLAVLPALVPETTDKCMDSIRRPDNAFGIDKVLLVDNSRDGSLAARYTDDPGAIDWLATYRNPNGHNLGVARSWNKGIEALYEWDMEYLVLLSASMIFGPILHTTFARQMETYWGSHVIEADGHSWHCIAFHRSVFDHIGWFDTNFYPAYFEAIDFGYRMRMFGLEGGWPRVWVNALSQGAALHNQIVSTPAPPLLSYYRRKWGGDKGEERFRRPWSEHGISYFPEHSIPELAKRYELEVWW